MASLEGASSDANDSLSEPSVDSDYDPDASSGEEVASDDPASDNSDDDESSADEEEAEEEAEEEVAEAEAEEEVEEEAEEEEVPGQKRKHTSRKKDTKLSKDDRLAMRESAEIINEKKTEAQIGRAAWTKRSRAFDGGVSDTYTLIAGARMWKADTAIAAAAKRAIEWALKSADEMEREDVDTASLNEGAREEYGAFSGARAMEAEFGGGTPSAEAMAQENATKDRIRVLAPWTTVLDLATYIKAEQDAADANEGAIAGEGERPSKRPMRAAKLRAIEGVRMDVQSDVREAKEVAVAQASAAAVPRRVRESLEQAMRTALMAHVLGFRTQDVTALRLMAVTNIGGSSKETDARQQDCVRIETVTKHMLAGMQAVAKRCHDVIASEIKEPNAANFVAALYKQGKTAFTKTADMSATNDPCAFTGMRLYDSGIIWTLHNVVVTLDEEDARVETRVTRSVAILFQAMYIITNPTNTMHTTFDHWCEGGSGDGGQVESYLRVVGASRLLLEKPDDVNTKLIGLDEATRCVNEFFESAVGESTVESVFASLNYITAFLSSVRNETSELHRAIVEHASSLQ